MHYRNCTLEMQLFMSKCTHHYLEKSIGFSKRQGKNDPIKVIISVPP